MPSFRIFTASQAKNIYLYKNLRIKVQNCCANICFNQQCLKLSVIPKYAQIKVRYTSPASTTTQKKIQTTHIREEIKFLYKKKDKLNEILYRTHLQAASEWGRTWDLIRDSIHNTTNRESEKKYRLLDNKIAQLKETQVEKIDNTYKFYPRVVN